MTHPDNNAFASTLPNDVRYKDEANYDGLTKREYFAAMAMQGLLANPEHRKEYEGQTYLMEPNIYADQSAKLADDLIEALNKTKQ